jgi:hypothetical protein
MLRVSIRATPETDVGEEIEHLLQAAEEAGLSRVAINEITREAETVAREFVDRGRQLKALGSQLQATRTIRGEGYEVRIRFEAQNRPTLISRIRAALRR